MHSSVLSPPSTLICQAWTLLLPLLLLACSIAVDQMPTQPAMLLLLGRQSLNFLPRSSTHLWFLITPSSSRHPALAVYSLRFSAPLLLTTKLNPPGQQELNLFWSQQTPVVGMAHKTRSSSLPLLLSPPRQ